METTSKPEYLSNLVNEDDFANMSNNNMYAFYSAPDTGKTTMITNVLQPYLKKNQKKALYLSPRIIINEQNRANFDDTVIHSETYQKIEQDLINHKSLFKDYDFIICDESHYFIEDSAMNNSTDISFNFVNESKNAVVILMSGTPDSLECIQESWNRPIIKRTDIDRSNHNLTKVCLASATKDEDSWLMAELDQLIEMRKRIIVYHSNIKDLFDLSNKYRKQQDELNIKVSFICSRNNKRYAKFIDKEGLETLTESMHIDSELLFITSALNTGVSIDEDYEYLFILGNPSKTDIIQLIARVRRGTTNRCFKTIYCSVPTFNSVRWGKLEGLRLDLTYLKDPVEWQSKKKSWKFPDFVKMPHRYLLDSEGTQLFTANGNPLTEFQPVINYMRLGKLQHDIQECEKLLSYGDTLEAYKQIFISRYDNITVTKLKDELELRCVGQLTVLFEKYVRQDYLDDDQQETIKTICAKHGQLTSIGKIKDLLAKYNCEFQLLSKQKKFKGLNLRLWYIQR